MAAPSSEQPSQIGRLPSWRGFDVWLEQHGDSTLNAVGTVFMWSAAAHAAYLAAVPESLRLAVAKRNKRLWQRLCVGALASVAVADSLHSACQAAQQRRIQEETRRLRAQLREAAPLVG